MDDQIGRVLAALGRKKMLASTVVVFQSDNGGTSNAMFAGEGGMSKLKIPCDNGPFRDGKGPLYEGGTRVPALINWPGRIKPGSTVEGMLHVVDMYPTLVAIARGTTATGKPLDGLNVWSAISEGRPSRRTEVVYNIEAFRAGVRQGDWKLVWRAPLPSIPELYNIAQDASEKNNVAAQHLDTVMTLQKRANDLAATMAKSLFLQTEFAKIQKRLGVPPALPGENFQFDVEPEAAAPTPPVKRSGRGGTPPVRPILR